MKAYSVYNHMLLPGSFRGLENDYWHLRSSVQIWDVSCQRQIEISGVEADQLAQLLTVRDIRNVAVGRCVYAPVVDFDGGLINDPVVIHAGPDRWWFSLADSDLGLWAEGLARGYGMEVRVAELDVWPLAIQGPKSEDVMSLVFGEAVRSIRFFQFERLEFEGRSMIVARSGWSAQGGFEVYVDDADVGVALYDALMEAGGAFDIGPGGPNLIERIEAGLLSYGGDMTRDNNPLECGLDQYCSLSSDMEAIGLSALRAHSERPLARRIRGLTIEGPPLEPLVARWPLRGDQGPIGAVTSAAWSPRLKKNIALAMVDTGAPDLVEVETPSGSRSAEVGAPRFP